MQAKAEEACRVAAAELREAESVAAQLHETTSELAAIMGQVHGDCDYCAYQGGVRIWTKPCKNCVNFAAKELATGDYWKWKGPGKEEKDRD
jgi:hypothetical protein